VSLVACPFCRETFEKSEAQTCPVCGLPLAAQEKLPLSYDAMAEGFVPTLPEVENKPFFYWRRNRGALALIALVGISLFFMPWIDMTIPEDRTITGFQLSRVRVQTWCVLVSWMVLAPTVLSRRSILKMRTARVTTAFLAAIPGVSIVLIAAVRQKSAFYTISYTFTYAFWATLVMSVLGIAFSWKFGGRLDDIDVGRQSGKSRVESKSKESLH
jgi:hypothetical protein